MVKKELFRGMDESQAKELSMEDFLPLINARERRTMKRVNQNPRLKQLIEIARKVKKDNPKKVIKTHVREAVVLPEWIGLTFGVYNGKEFKNVEITVKHLGKRLGEFAHSTGRVMHSGPGVGATRGSKFVPLK
ncbi:30S ribosomal protein S19 [Candidatus Micrarchaeota archaeon]|nr:30S ribosomal protein S19 [Candidatus Micrarchaeota archaeon]MBD3418271.1 30S ribosomal protein S19 [Candidatus Micrarchaeota archaeon]